VIAGDLKTGSCGYVGKRRYLEEWSDEEV